MVIIDHRTKAQSQIDLIRAISKLFSWKWVLVWKLGFLRENGFL